jgi:hypothetical protein
MLSKSDDYSDDKAAKRRDEVVSPYGEYPTAAQG